MSICKKQKQKRPPLQPKFGPYTKTNAYTQAFSSEQIATFLLAILIVILHSIFNVHAIIKINHPILLIMLAFNYILIVSLVITYIQITIFDPVDTFIQNPFLLQIKHKKIKTKYCQICKARVHYKSYHCKRCNRCTQNFDHHCVYLNNCIGSRNYELFIRILIIFVLFLINNIGQSIWVFVAARQSQQIRSASISEWLSITIIILSTIPLVATLMLLGFHFYISCCLDVTTLYFMQSQGSMPTKDDKISIQERLKFQSNIQLQSPDLIISNNKILSNDDFIAVSSGMLV